ncbi:EscC/YscC/HrcC family type III secretion system outer membrane ring protein [Pseudomonas sp. 6D_7.1_Bac1]|jgi:type III secretion protein C|uniref:EscC/YscC/HrcC family type III secretion system outer membrane ring protein n=1 Tax=Pseudomonas sp. 6D_7.1_Bac1 TaxID=2971615 RepID=UPI0021C8E605|nr:EscC/YscC/HrcC family type III secretion system outer membrane ring protein [Pseudomonas sp. 6D_7.1_Bac1]MCU1748806.1 EscC/YscC/HrcC family type III secretion system outer membrane ring protein [Pseudomonas sp. 6D_7.1_Bac1]
MVGLIALGVATSTIGAIPTNGSPAFFLTTRGTKLADVLRDLGANYRVPVVVSPLVGEAFIGSLSDMEPEQALEHLAQLYQLAWYYDGQTIYVYKAQEVGSQLLTPAYLSVQTLIAQLRATGVLDRRYCRVRAVPTSNALEVHGVPICLERVARLAERIDQQKLNHEQNQEVVELFPLKYAAAADTQYTYRTQQVVIPGIVSVLKDMAQGRTLPLKENQGEQPSSDRSLPMFSADPRQNAVLVRDRKINLPLYSDLIAQLDHKPKLVEISVAIIDVNSQDLSALGVDWSASTRIGGAGVSFNSGGELDSGNFSTVISNTGNFMVRLSALEQNAKARILSRPSVVTLNNMQAVLDRNITFYTKLVAENVAKLESISAGSLLRVTPRVVGEGAQQEVMLTLIIQDGRQTSPISQAEPLPQTLNSEISTHALLKAGQALLLGGFVQDEESESVRKIPLLGDIPLLGRLFRTTQKTNRQTVRLFLIKADPWHQS